MILEQLQVALKNKYDTEFRDGVHVSDLVLCHRKSIIRKLEPQAVTMTELGYFTSGRAIHDAIATLAQENPKYTQELEIKVGDVVGHVDLYDSENNIPIECKSSRVKEVKEPYSHHVDQLKSYMAMLGANKGVLLYQLLLNSNGTPFVEFEIEMTNEEIQIQLGALEIASGNYKLNLDNKTPMQASNVFNNPKMNWLCKNCPYLKRCCDNENK